MSNHPISNFTFFSLLEDTQCVGNNTGWIPKFFHENDTILPTYIKYHGYGEYIFDWNWANFYDQNHLSYYPKLLHAIPFTPVNAPKIIGESSKFKHLVDESFKYYQENDLTGEHYLFINDEEENVLINKGFAIKKSHQYHFRNEYKSFDEFLSKLKKNKRKNIKKERKAIIESGLKIDWVYGDALNKELLDEFYLYYLTTIYKKYSHPYLTKDFFYSLSELNVLLVQAKKDETTIAMSLFFYGEETLYGRYWGINPKNESEYPYLHFELCYYQGIEFCIKKGLKLFEAGAQGEHKLLRGFEPVIIKSAHHIKIPQCFNIIKNDIMMQNQQVEDSLIHMKSYLPYKDKL
jgi:predicted N-acyltransferase